MWEGLVRAPRGRVSARNLIVLLATCLVAFLAHLLFISTPVHAADAYWKDGAIVYADHTYTKQTATSSDNLGLAAGTEYYLYTEPIPGTQARKAFIIYFASGTSPPQASEAKHKTYTLTNGKFTNGSQEKSFTIEPTAAADTGEKLKPGELNSCSVEGGLGWIICPSTRWIANAMDSIYDVISEFLKVQPLQTTTNGPLYMAWDVARNLANICFIIGFLIIIYTQVTGGTSANYTIKKIMPRIVVAAVLVNTSYWICSLAVDASNILGYSVQDLFNIIRESLATTPFQMRPFRWGEVAEAILSNGAIAVGTGAGLYSVFSVYGVIGSLYLFLIVIVSVIMAALVALLVLAARQALITILVIVAPLAFVLYLLPNTEKWFAKWRDVFATMMFMFPIFSVIFGGSQLAGAIIIQNAQYVNNGFATAIAIMGLAVQVAPLVLTPIIVKFSGSLLGRIAGMVNNPNKGLIDRTKKFAHGRADMHKDRLRANAAKRFDKDGKIKRNRDRFRPTNLSYRHERARMHREEQQKVWQERTAAAIHDDEKFQRMGRDSYSPFDTGKPFEDQREHLDTYKRTTDAMHKRTEAEHEKHWNERMELGNKHFNQDTFDREVETRKLSDQAQLSKEKLETVYTEMKAGKDPFAERGLTAQNQKALQSQIDAIQTTAKRISVEALRKQSAEVVLQENLAKNLKEGVLTINREDATGKPIVIETNIRDYAGGIAGTSGSNRVYAKATADIVSTYLEDVKNSRSIISDHSIVEVLDIAMKGKRRDGTQATQAEIDAAIQETLLAKGNNWSVQKLKDHIASQGMYYDEATNKYYDDKSKSPASEITDPEVIEARRTRQQIFVDAYNQSKHKVQNLSGTDRGLLENGTFTMSSQETILRDIRDQKINATRIAGTDIDELMRMVQVLRDDSARENLRRQSPEAYKTLTETIDFALNDPQIKASIAPREQKMIGVIQKYINDPRPVIPLSDKRTYEASTETPIPTNYTTDEFYGLPDTFGGTEPTGPR